VPSLPERPRRGGQTLGFSVTVSGPLEARRRVPTAGARVGRAGRPWRGRRGKPRLRRTSREPTFSFRSSGGDLAWADAASAVCPLTRVAPPRTWPPRPSHAGPRGSGERSRCLGRRASRVRRRGASHHDALGARRREPSGDQSGAGPAVRPPPERPRAWGPGEPIEAARRAEYDARAGGGPDGAVAATISEDKRRPSGAAGSACVRAVLAGLAGAPRPRPRREADPLRLGGQRTRGWRRRSHRGTRVGWARRPWRGRRGPCRVHCRRCRCSSSA
jgi:hypothetical protein